MNSGPTAETRAALSLFDCVCIIVGVIIGSGIYRTTPLITSAAGSSSAAICIWLLGGLIVLNGALCYAELVTSHPRRGGDYAFLNMAYGRWFGFLFAWTEFWIIRPANVGAMAFVYGEYAQQLVPVSGFPQFPGAGIHAAIAIAALTVVNLFGIRSGTRTQNLLTTLKVLGLSLLLSSLFFAPAAEPTSAESELSFGGFQLAIILVLFTYGGWNDVSYVAAEVRDPRRNLPRALIIGTVLVISIYLLVNLAMLWVLGYEGVSQSTAVAADLMTRSFGPWGGDAISFLICVSCLGAISAMIFTGSRIYHALGMDHAVVGWLGRWSARGVPIQSVVSQGLVMLLMVIALGRDGSGFERLAVFAAPFFWLFFTMVSISIFVFRYQRSGEASSVDAPSNEPPSNSLPVFQAPLYPIGPILFVASCLFMLYSSASYLITSQLLDNPWSFQGIWTCVILCSGAGFGAWAQRS